MTTRHINFSPRPTLGPWLVLLVLVGLACSGTRAKNWAGCTANDPDRKIGGCTAVIQAGQESNDDLAKAFFNRGNAYRNKGEYDRAIQDFDEAIRLNPKLALAFNNRGIAYGSKGQHDRAI